MKKGEVFFDAITDIRDDLVETAQTFRFSGAWGRRIRRYAPAAAGLILVVGIGMFIASGGLRMGGSSANSADSGDTGDSATAGGDGWSTGGSQENGAADGESVSPSPTFSDTAGPILPLSFLEQNDAITAQRAVTLDFDGYGERKAFWEDGYRIGVTDSYVLTNAADTDQTVTLLYPVAGNLGELDTPEITMDGKEISLTAAVGAELDGDRDRSWQQWRDVLEDADYRADALDGPTDLSAVPAVVYTVSNQHGPSEYEAATLALEFSYDPDETTVMQYGFHGMSRGDGNTVKYSGSGFVRDEAEDWYLIVLGADIQNPRLQGYEDGGCDAGEELSGVGGTLTRTETTLEAILRTLVEDYWNRPGGKGQREDVDVPYEVFYAAVADSVLEDTMYLPLLDEFLFAQKTQADRVVWFTAKVTIPAGGSVEVEAVYTKAASLNSGPPDLPYKDVCGYEILTQAGSNLTFTGQVARVVNGEDLTLWEGGYDRDDTLGLGETGMTAGEGAPARDRYVLYTMQ